MKCLIACMLLIVSTIAEPPVDNRYLPPQQGGGSTRPSTTYGAPGNGRQTSAIFGGRSNGGSRRPSLQYGVPGLSSGAPSNQYGTPSQLGSFGNTPSSKYRAPSPSSQYGAPNNGPPSSQYGAPRIGSGTPSSQYGAPSSQYGASDTQARQPSALYGTPALDGSRGFSSQSSRPQAPGLEYGPPSTPSQQYGAPGFDGNGGASGYKEGAQSREYLPPGVGNGNGGYGEDGNGEPANYSFEYMVKDEPSGNDFGHRESRQGDRAEGLYYVLLPDGRKQTVEYEADEGGYKPKISYEDTGAGGYGNQGYDGNQGGPY